MRGTQLKVLLFLFFLSSLAFSQTVYKTKTGKKYHKETCTYLSKSKISIELGDAIAQDLTSCSKCKPTSSLKAKSSKENNTKTSKEATANRCKGKTKSGSRCKRTVSKGSNYCWQHK